MYVVILSERMFIKLWFMFATRLFITLWFLFPVSETGAKA